MAFVDVDLVEGKCRNSSIEKWIDHDKLFKKLTRRFFVEFMQGFYPELARDMDIDSVRFLDKEDNKRKKTKIADMLVEAKFAFSKNSVLIHIEFKAQRVRGYSRKVYEYFNRFYEEHGNAVISIVVHTHDVNVTEESGFVLDTPYIKILEFNHFTLQLSREPWRKYLDKPNPLTVAFMTKMSYQAEEKVDVKIECFRMLESLDLGDEDYNILISFIETYLVLNEEEETIFDKKLDKKEVEKVMEFITSYELRGREEGFKKGERKGERKGIEQVAKNLLEVGDSIDKIIRVTGLSKERILEL